MNASDYAHLHCHSDFSLLDGAAKVSSLAKAAKAAGQTAVALTDHGSVSGIIEFVKACDKQGVKPILGCEAYLAPGLDEEAHKRRGKDAEGKDIRDEGTGRKKSYDYDHFTIIAKNDQGWRNLQKLASIASLEGYYYRPRVSWHLLTKHREGLIALSGCLSGQLSNAIKKDRFEEAEQHARRWKDLFGDDYYVELQPVVGADAPGSDLAFQQKKANDACLAIARRLGLRTVATADVHYVDPVDAEVQEIKICTSSYKTLKENRESGLNMPPVFYFKKSEEMFRYFSGYEDAILATREIAEKCEKIKVFPGRFFLPTFKPPTGETPVDYFRRLCREGLIRRYGGEGSFLNAARLEYELACIEKMDLVNYFLIVHDFVAWARNNGVPVGPGRGSAAGSVASYCLGITNIDPLRYDLLFERFLNPDRVSMPDIDLDFCERGRHRVIEYVKNRYGEKCVAQIITFGESKAKTAIRDVGRVLEIPHAEVNRIAKLIPEVTKPVDKNKTILEEALEGIPELKVMYETNAGSKRLFDLALGLEGLYRTEGKHAAGVVIGDTDLMERIPLKLVPPNKEDSAVCTAFSMEQVEEVGLLKMDFLGLSTITQIYDTVALMKKSTGVDLDPDTIPVRDAHSMETTTGAHLCPVHKVAFAECRCCDKTLEVFQRADTSGIFQVESSGMRKLLKQMKPDRFDDLIAIMALYRPGPLGSDMDQDYVKRKNGEEPIVYDHPKLEPILKKTMGLFIYQEALMQMSVALAGFTMPQADELRKATAKKKPEAMAKIKDKFILGCVKNSGLAVEHATELWEKIVFFSEYSFNCVAGDSEIVCADTGRVWAVKDLAASRPRIRVHAIGDDFVVRKRRVTKVWSTGVRQVFELRTRSGRVVMATADHRFRKLEGWRALRDLTSGDYVAVARELHATGDASMKHHEIVSLAALLTEGNTCHPGTLYCTNKDSPEFLREVAKAFSVFPNTVVRHEGRGSKATNVVANLGPGARGSARHGERSGIFQWAGKLGILGKSATQKSIPDIVFRLNEKDLSKFIGRLWTGDGYVGWTDTPGRHAPFYATSSVVMAKQVHLLLARLGIASRLDEKRFKYRYERKGLRSRPSGSELAEVGSGKDAKGRYALRRGFVVRLVGRLAMETFRDRVLPEIVGYGPQKKHFLQLLSTFDDRASRDIVPASVRNLVQVDRPDGWGGLEAAAGVSMSEFRRKSPKRGFTRQAVEAIASAVGHVGLANAASRDVFWDEVVSVTPVGKHETYDLEVEGDHNFAVNCGIIAHNCSHSAAYGLISWQTGWLKANYPIEFTAALLTSWAKDTDKLAGYVEEARRLQVPIEPPDVNKSEAGFTIRIHPNGLCSIVYGLDALKGVGPDAVAAILDARRRVGRFRSIFHFCEEVDQKKVTTGVMETLAQAGAFGSTGASRSQILEKTTYVTRKGRGPTKEVTENAIEAAIRFAKGEKKVKASGQSTLFAAAPETDDLLPRIPEWPMERILEAERDALGLYLSGHPLERYMDVIREFATVTSSRAAETTGHVYMGGIVRAVHKHITTTGKEMAFLTIEDTAGVFDGMVSPRIWEEKKDLLRAGAVIFIGGDLDNLREPPSVKVDDVIPIDEAQQRLGGSRFMRIWFYSGLVDRALTLRVNGILGSHPGIQNVTWGWKDKKTGAETPLKAHHVKVRVSQALRQELTAALEGRGEVVVERR